MKAMSFFAVGSRETTNNCGFFALHKHEIFLPKKSAILNGTNGPKGKA
jgi:hypothetical protein